MGGIQKVASKEAALDTGILIGKYFFKSEYLHYGYWTDGMEVKIDNISAAQEKYSDLIVSHIPEGTKSILDVGCGVGKLAEKMIDAGYQVDCVSPSIHLSNHARRLLGGRSHIFECRFEDIDTTKTYDLVLFSESFQYIRMDRSFENAIKLLNPQGHILICDYFTKQTEGKSPIGGGHGLNDFYQTLKNFPIEIGEDIDITKETAPTLDIWDEFLNQIVAPIWEIWGDYFKSNFPRISWVFAWKFKKKLSKKREKYLGKKYNRKSFLLFKSYRLISLNIKD
jgi:SAM-dependent methyltransferase